MRITNDRKRVTDNQITGECIVFCTTIYTHGNISCSSDNKLLNFFLLYNEIFLLLKHCLPSLYGHVQMRRVNIFH